MVGGGGCACGIGGEDVERVEVGAQGGGDGSEVLERGYYYGKDSGKRIKPG